MSLLELHSVTKQYPGVKALDNVDFSLSAGSVHALVGENGAGKSTLLKVLAGATTPERGTIELRGETVQFSNPRDALNAGITVIYQELSLVPHLGADANIFLGMELSRWGVLDRVEMFRVAGKALESLGFDQDPSTPVRNLSVAQQQLIELARTLVRETTIVAFDEPTATLTPHEADHLFDQIDLLRQKGVGVIFVSHRLEEVRRIADTVTVLRDGSKIFTGPIQETSDAELIKAMVGREVEYTRIESGRVPDEEPVLELQALTNEPKFRDISFELRRGEIVGLAGLVGSGRTEVARAIAGIDQLDSGKMVFRGESFNPKSPRNAIDSGVVYFSEDRKRDGLVLGMLVRENVSLSTLDSFTKLGVVRQQEEAEAAQKMVANVDLRPPDIERPARTLSGGNQQKVVFAKGLLADADVLLLDEPTRGVDVGAKVELHKQIRSLADSGKAVLVISSELPEVLALADRVVVLREGNKAGELASNEMTSESIISLAVAAK